MFRRLGWNGALCSIDWLQLPVTIHKSVVLLLFRLYNGVYHLFLKLLTALYTVSSKQRHIRYVARKNSNEHYKAKPNEQTKWRC